jgi:hypothetical protein
MAMVLIGGAIIRGIMMGIIPIIIIMTIITAKVRGMVNCHQETGM